MLSSTSSLLQQQLLFRPTRPLSSSCFLGAPTRILRAGRRRSLSPLQQIMYHSKQKHRGTARRYNEQLWQQRKDNVTDYLRRRHIHLDTAESSGRRSSLGRDRLMERLHREGVAVNRDAKNRSELLALQGLGDRQPLETASMTPLDARQQLLYNSDYERVRDARGPPPESYSTPMARRIMTGESWPAVPSAFETHSRVITELENDANMSPSARRTAAAVLFVLQQNLPACPLQIRERLDWGQLILSDVIASRRSQNLYLVWSTVHPSARFAMEPHLAGLDKWIRALLRVKIRFLPTLPHRITWVYDTGELQRRLPRALTREMEQQFLDVNVDARRRVQYLRKLDSLSERMKGVPWFMPYLWGKERQRGATKTMGEDLKTIERRKSGSGIGIGGTGGTGGGPRFVS